MAARLRRTQPAQAAPPPHAELTAQRPPSPAAKSWDRPNQRLAARICVPDPPSAPSHGFVRQADLCVSLDVINCCGDRQFNLGVRFRGAPNAEYLRRAAIQD